MPAQARLRYARLRALGLLSVLASTFLLAAGAATPSRSFPAAVEAGPIGWPAPFRVLASASTEQFQLLTLALASGYLATLAAARSCLVEFWQ